MGNEADRLRIEEASVADAVDLRELALSARIDAWTAAGYAEEIESENSIVIKATNPAERLTGMLVARIVPSGGEGVDAELYNIAVSPDLLRQGLGAVLMRRFLDIARTRSARNVWLEVRESNHGAVAFYRKHGFFKEIVRRNFYRDPTEDAIVMRLEISPETERSATIENA